MSQPSEEFPTLRAFAPALTLLTIAFLINYVDRGNLSVAAPILRRELHLSPSQIGLLLGAFFPTYTVMQFIMGWLVDHFDANRILAVGFLLWSLATATTGLVHGFVLLFAMRLILGIGESVALPAGSKILAWHLPEHHRGFAGGLLMSGLRFGNAIGTLASGFLMIRYGWRPVFIGVGLISLIWLPAWAKWMPRGHKPVPAQKPKQTGGPSTLQILMQRSFWGTTVGHFACNYLFYFMIAWLPSYLVDERHLTMATMTKIAGLYYSVDAFASIIGGSVQDRLIHRGHAPTLVRKAAMAIGFSLGAIGVAGCAVAGAKTYLPWLMMAGVGCGMVGPGIYAFCQRLAGSQAVGRWYGPQNGFANFAGVVGPALSGYLVERTGNYLVPFGITSAVCVLGVIAWVWIVGRVEPVAWNLKADVHAVPAPAGI